MAGENDLPRRDFLGYLAGGAGGMVLGTRADSAGTGPAPIPFTAAMTDVRGSGARGDGETDDTDAIQRAASATPVGGILLFPPGLYVVSSTILMPPGITVTGSGIGDLTSTGISALTVMDSLFKWDDGTATGACVRNLTIAGPRGLGGGDLDAGELGSCGLDFGRGGSNLSLSGLYLDGFTNAVVFRQQQSVRIDDVTSTNAGSHGLALLDSVMFTITGGLFGNVSDPTDHAANVYLRRSEGSDRDVASIHMIGVSVDEAIGNAPSMYIRNGRDVTFDSGLVYIYEGEVGILIGDGGAAPPSDVTIANSLVIPYGTHAPSNTIRIMPGATNTTLLNVKTRIPHGGGDIDDRGTGTVSINLNQSGAIT
ncbi:MAG: glycosyl hydrolase family 28-related protein [Actinomycetota bacterium]